MWLKPELLRLKTLSKIWENKMFKAIKAMQDAWTGTITELVFGTIAVAVFFFVMIILSTLGGGLI